MARMLSRMQGSHCPACRALPGPDCSDRAKSKRQRRRIEVRGVDLEVREELATLSLVQYRR